MYWLEKLKDFKTEAGATYRDIALKTGIAQSTVEKIFSGRTNDPKLMMTEQIANALGHSIAELLPGTAVLSKAEKRFLHDFRALDSEGRSRVEAAINGELRRVRAEAAAVRRYPCLYYDFPVSAGTGEYPDYSTARVIELDSEPPHGTDFILRIAGDSMEPDFSDGDRVFVNSSESLEFGDIGIFAYAGNVYIKEYTSAGLRSLNPKYKLIKGREDMRILGRVIGKA